MVRQVVVQKTPGIFKVAPCLPEELVMGIAHIVHAGGVFIVNGTLILDSLLWRVKV